MIGKCNQQVTWSVNMELTKSATLKIVETELLDHCPLSHPPRWLKERSPLPGILYNLRGIIFQRGTGLMSGCRRKRILRWSTENLNMVWNFRGLWEYAKHLGEGSKEGEGRDQVRSGRKKGIKKASFLSAKAWQPWWLITAACYRFFLNPF